MEIKAIEGGICAAKGFKAAGMAAGIKKNGKPDLAMVVCEKECAAAAVFTRNKVKASPVYLTTEHLKNGRARGILANSGNANACTPDGAEVAKRCCEAAAKATGLRAEDFAIASTGVIGQSLDAGLFEAALPDLAARLSVDGSVEAARAIMTTDTVPKEFAVEFELNGKRCRVGAIAKGSGMININMATMLMFVTTDADIAPDVLQQALATEVEASLNQVCVDGDMSTNDTLILLASGLAGNAAITQAQGADYEAFGAALHDICVKVSRALARDGEGATKLIECHVNSAPSVEIARAVSKTVIASDLFKAAMFGADANWGRALCAIGYTPGDFSVDNVRLRLQSAAGEVLVCEGSMHHDYSEEEASKILAEEEIRVLIDLGCGDAEGMAWGCDLTYDYVKINGDYRS